MTEPKESTAQERQSATDDGIEEHHVGTNITTTILENDHDRPPLPPRPSMAGASQRKISTTLVEATLPKDAKTEGKRPRLQSTPTTALSSIDIQTISFPDGSRETYSTSHNNAAGESISGTSTRKASQTGSETDDIASLSSRVPTLRASDDLQSLLDESLNSESLAWRMLNIQSDPGNFDDIGSDTQLATFDKEFDEIAAAEDGNEGMYQEAKTNTVCY